MYTNPNIFGVVSALSIAALQIIFFYKRMKFLLFIILMILLLTGVYLSGSRMSIALSLVSIVLFNLYVRLHKDWFLIFVVVLIAAVTFLFEIIETVVDLNFRGVIWAASLDVIEDNLFFGVGLGNLQYSIQNYSSEITWTQSANNFFIGWLAEAGLVSSILFLFLFFKFTRIKMFAKEGFSFFLILLLVSQFSEYFIIYVSIFTFLLISMLSMRHKKNGM
jgi:O-antigen ligase